MKQENKKAYLFYSVSNSAETWRDPDNLNYSFYRVFSSIENANKYIAAALDQPDLKIKLNEKGKWHYSNFGSFTPTYVLEAIDMDGEYDTFYRDREKGMQKWAEELGMIEPEPKNEPYKSKYLKNVDELK